ncbi:MAG: nucleotidyl transferase AbiEii/AbiGii toxin family protein [Elusimicrobiales bacterium]|nr:nucleotidyl transferase AbiEii/AbiGii toxin family protein [Elusimicrobiales bacterium]
MDSIATLSSKERGQLFAAAEVKHTPRIIAPIIEKDFWACWTLHRLFDVMQFRPHLIFKGGTSLSKVYKAIERFSEDVDLSLSRRDLGFAEARDPEQSGISAKERRRRLEDLTVQCRNTIRDQMLPALRHDFTSVLGKSGWTVELDVADPQTVIFVYPQSAAAPANRYIRPAIRLEMGARSDDWPSVDAEIMPYAAESFPDMFKLPICTVRTLDAERTFWEKATLLHAEYHRPSDKPSKERLSRHYYDLCCLARKGFAAKALGNSNLLKRVVQHKSLFFAQTWAGYDSAKPGTFRLVPPESRIRYLRKDYDAMKPMLFGETPSWDAIIQALQQLENQINEH